MPSIFASAPAGERDPKSAELLATLDTNDMAASRERVAAFLEDSGIPLEGARTLGEIAERLVDMAADAKESPLPVKTVELIESYLAVSGPLWTSLETIAEMASKAGINIAAALDAARKRFERFEQAGMDLAQFTFNAEFGRDLEYYTGHVFQVELPDRGRAGQIAGGGRYDDLLQGLGAPVPTPAVGSAIHTERLLSAVSGGQQ